MLCYLLHISINTDVFNVIIIQDHEKELETERKEIIEFTKELDKVRDAETILDTHKIETEEQRLRREKREE